MMRRLPPDVGLRREPLVQTSQNVSRCLCGLACTWPAQASRCRRSPRAACHAPPDTPLVGQFVRVMRSLQAYQYGLTSVEKVRKRRRQQRDTRHVQQPFPKLLVGNRVSAARAVPLPLQLEPMVMMIDDIRVKVTVMIGTASRTQGELPKKTKMGTHSKVLPTSLFLTSAFRTLRRATYLLTDVSLRLNAQLVVRFRTPLFRTSRSPLLRRFGTQ